MCPHNDKEVLCYHSISDLHILFATLPSEVPPERLFCLAVATSTIEFLSQRLPTVNFSRLDQDLGDLQPGQPLPELLLRANVWPAMYFNGPDIFAGTLEVFARGVRRWLERCTVEGGLLVPGEREGEWHWATAVRLRGISNPEFLADWVREEVWKGARKEVLREVLRREEIPSDPEELSPRQKEMFVEYRQLAPDEFPETGAVVTEEEGEEEVAERPSQQRLPIHNQKERSERSDGYVEMAAGRIVEHRVRAHHESLKLDEHARVKATRGYMDDLEELCRREK